MRKMRLMLALLMLLALPALASADDAVGLVATVAGSAGAQGSADGAGAEARFYRQEGIALSGDGSLALVADTRNDTIRRIDMGSGAVTTLAGQVRTPGTSDGAGMQARFTNPAGIALSADSSFALIADTDNHTIRRIDVISSTVTTLAGAGGTPGSADGTGTGARFAAPSGVALSGDGSFALIADTDNHTIRRIDLAGGTVTTLAGLAGNPGSADGVGGAARFDLPRGIALSGDGSFALISDSNNHTIRRLVIASGTVTTLAGQAGSPGSADGAAAQFTYPAGLALSADGSFALVADFSNHTIRRIDVASGVVTTVAGLADNPGSADGAGISARLNYPRGVALSGDGSFALVADTYNHTIRRINLFSVPPRLYLPIVSR